MYINKDLQRKLGELKRWTEEREEGVRVVIGGDFNARTGEEEERMGEEVEEGGGEMGSRRSKDEVVNGEGRRLCRYLEERGWGILNGNEEGDEEGEWTYTGGRGNSVIDYVLGNEEMREGVERMEVGERIDSDHHPVIVCLRGEEGDQEKGLKKGGGKERGERKMDSGRQGGFRGEVWKKRGERERNRGRMGRTEEKSKRGNGERRGKKGGWWDMECREKKGRVRKELRRWRKEGGDGKMYAERRKEYRKLCEEKKKKEVEGWEKELEGVRNEGQVWKVVIREMKKRRGVNEEIKLEEWEEYFRELLGGVEWRVRRDVEERRGDDDEGNIEKEEIRRVLRGLKDGKAMGGDGIPNEVWKYGGEEVEEWLWEVCNRVWKGDGWPEEWKVGIVVPVVKKGVGKRVEEYRGVTLTQTAYKVYPSVLAERLRKEVEEKGMLPPSQAGFRGGDGMRG